MSELIVRELRLRPYRAPREASSTRPPAAGEAQARTAAVPATTPVPSPRPRVEHGIVL